MSGHFNIAAWRSAVYRDGPLSRNAVSSAGALAEFLGKSGAAYPSIATLSKLGRQSESSTRRGLAELEARGHLRMIRRGNRTTVYQAVQGVTVTASDDLRVSEGRGRVSVRQSEGVTVTPELDTKLDAEPDKQQATRVTHKERDDGSAADEDHIDEAVSAVMSAIGAFGRIGDADDPVALDRHIRCEVMRQLRDGAARHEQTTGEALTWRDAAHLGLDNGWFDRKASKADLIEFDGGFVDGFAEPPQPAPSMPSPQAPSLKASYRSHDEAPEAFTIAVRIIAAKAATADLELAVAARDVLDEIFEADPETTPQAAAVLALRTAAEQRRAA